MDPKMTRLSTPRINTEVERFLVKVPGRDPKTPCKKALVVAIDGARVHTGKNREGVGYKSSVLDRPNVLLVISGGFMEDAAALIQVARDELEESKKSLQDLQNQIAAVDSIIRPQLVDMIKRLRDSRMTVVSEINSSLAAMREVRRFFLDAEYGTEIERLERFVALCREFQSLKASGILDAISDTMIHLAVKETHQ